jgi:hypothetical protein
MLFKNSVRTSKRTLHFTITKINWLTLFKFNYGYKDVEYIQPEAVRILSKQKPTKIDIFGTIANKILGLLW